jgi:kynureninase
MGMPSRADCESLDARDPLGRVAAEFAAGEPGWLYFDANSIGAMPRTAQGALARIADEWRRLRRRGWKDSDWLDAPARLGNKLAPIIGAEPGSVVVCDSTSINIYKAVRVALGLRPGRKTVVAEAGAFPTDLYVAEAAAPKLVTVTDFGDLSKSVTVTDLAVILVTHTDYRSAYRHDLAALCRAAHERGALVVCDASHSAGAVDVGLAAASVDFGVGCGYKYLCGGPGAPAWLYVAPRHQSAAPVIPGWMGHADPMAMSPDYKPAQGAKRHLAGTPPVETTDNPAVFSLASVASLRALVAGAIFLFLFVQGTDPECALLLEANSDKTWRYAFARQNAASLQADLDGKQVLDMPPHQRPPDGESAYVTVTPPEAKAAP